MPPLKSIKISTMGRALLHYVLENQEEDPLVKESLNFFVPKSLHAMAQSLHVMAKFDLN